MTGRQDTAEEIVQDAFIKYYERQDTLPKDDGLKYWMIRVVKNQALNHEKRRLREAKAFQRYFHEPKPAMGPEGEKSLVRSDTIQEVQEALLKVPYNLRIVLVLKEYTGFNYAEIAKMLNISEGNVKVRVFRARAQLASLLPKEGT